MKLCLLLILLPHKFSNILRTHENLSVLTCVTRLSCVVTCLGSICQSELLPPPLGHGQLPEDSPVQGPVEEGRGEFNCDNDASNLLILSAIFRLMSQLCWRLTGPHTCSQAQASRAPRSLCWLAGTSRSEFLSNLVTLALDFYLST